MTNWRRSTTPPTTDRVTTNTGKRSVETAGSAGLCIGIEMDRVYYQHICDQECVCMSVGECVCVCVCMCVCLCVRV